MLLFQASPDRPPPSSRALPVRLLRHGGREGRAKHQQEVEGAQVRQGETENLKKSNLKKLKSHPGGISQPTVKYIWLWFFCRIRETKTVSVATDVRESTFP